MTGNQDPGGNAREKEWLQDRGEEEGVIEIPRSAEFVATAQAVSDYINDLGLSTAQNNRLIELLTAHVLKAEVGGFRYGLKIGLAYGRRERAEEPAQEATGGALGGEQAPEGAGR